MCSVEVALIADVLRLTEGQRFRTPGVPPRSICRRLFADEGGETSTTCMHRLESELERQVRQRWNFDFRAEKPLPGRYQWVPVRPACLRTSPEVIVELPQTTTGQESRAKSSGKPRPTLPERTQVSRSSQASTTQSKITDFLHQRKRLRSPESDLPCAKTRRTTLEPRGPSIVTID